MEKEQSALISFINMHAHKAVILKDTRCVQITKYRESGIPLDVTLKKWSMQYIVNNYDVEDKLTQWVLNQLNTYNPNKEIVIGLEFENKKLLTHVIKLEKDDD
jgi:hypothetical protein